MQLFKNKWFYRFAKKEKISDELLSKAIEEINTGLLDANLGGNLIKKRIARKGQGKSGGYRSIIIFKEGDKAFFVYAFAKNDRDNLTKAEIDAFKLLAKEVLAFSKKQLEKSIEDGIFIEVERPDDNET